jgi:hypothetical protein
MLRFQRFRPPSPDDRAAWAAEQRWLIEDARLVGEIHVIGLCLAAALIVAAVGATFGLRALAGFCFLACCGGVARIVYLIIRRYRMFVDIKIAGGMTKKGAVLEFNSRYSD